MTPAENDVLIGAAVREYVEAEQAMGLLEAQIAKAWETLEKMRCDIQSVPTTVDPARAQALGTDLGQHLGDLAKAAVRKRERERCLDRVGVPAFLKAAPNP